MSRWRIGIAAAMAVCMGIGAQTEEQEAAARYAAGLAELVKYQKQVRDIHPFFRTLYPLAVVENEVFYVFAPDEGGGAYELVKSARPAMIVPRGVRAAFPLEFYDNKMACVVTGDVFEEPSGFATIFHEFVHCAQMETVEPHIKARLTVARKAQAEDDFMWELNHPFPYEDEPFQEIYGIFLESAAAEDRPAVARCRSFLKEVLNLADYEYMVWQEWKEGFARFLENKVRVRLGLDELHSPDTPPFDRVTFYEGGARWIALLVEEDAELMEDIEALFQRMAGVV